MIFSVDLKDVYLQILIHLDSHFYLLKALHFRLSSAPQVFTRVVALVSEWVHKRGI